MEAMLIGSNTTPIMQLRREQTANWVQESASGLPLSETKRPASVIWIAQKKAQMMLRISPVVSVSKAPPESRNMPPSIISAHGQTIQWG
ncbi:hypothetical protein D3C78_1476680 [compost metagenome]